MLKLEDFRLQRVENLRFSDTDLNGHVNNAVFATLFENGRVFVFRDAEGRHVTEGRGFVVARIAIDFKKEIMWPGTVAVGTGVKSLGRTSVTFFQALFQNEQCVATAEVVQVHINQTMRRPEALAMSTRSLLEPLMLSTVQDQGSQA
jgi:acyl-CoA thioester hydrolase